MTRLIIIIAVVVAVIWLVRRAIAGPRSRGAGPAADAGEQKGELVGCARCGVNLPQTEARTLDGKFYCSEEHLRLGPKGG